jgi:hypothetical protein
MIYFYLSPGWFSNNKCKTCLQRCIKYYTLIKKKTKFSSYLRKFRWDWVKAIYEEGLPHIWGNAQIFSPYMRRSLVIYVFAPEPSEFPYIWGKFYFLFISAHAHLAINILQYIKLGFDLGRRMPVYCLFFAVGKENSQICYDILHNTYISQHSHISSYKK